MNHITPSWRDFRGQFPVTNEWAYFDNAAVAPLSGPARSAIVDWAAAATDHGDTEWPAWSKRIEEVRKTAAQLLNAAPKEIAFIPHTSFGIGLVAEGIPWKSGDNVVIPDNEFPANVYPWLNLADRGVETRRIPTSNGAIDLDQLADTIDNRTRLLSISWVGYGSGWRIDVAKIVELAHARNVLVFLDAIQGLGVFPLDVLDTGIDFLAADGHKWMASPEGAGLFFVRHQHLDLLRPFNLGWHSVVQPHDYSPRELELLPTASRYEGGSANTVGILALGASLDLLVQFGLSATESRIAERVLAVGDLACEKLRSQGASILSNRDPAHASGIVSFDVPGASPSELRNRCLDAGIVLSCRNGHLRISPHAYNDEDDLARLLEAISG